MARTPRLPDSAALYLLASLVVSLLASSSAPTPLYALYQQQWGFSPITTTIVFGVYAVSVLAALLVLGKLSDHLGRKPVLLVALVVQAAAMLVFATADGVAALLVARVVQGVATGAAIGALGAGMLDLDAQRGQLANAVAPGIGTAVGALFSALLVSYLPAPTELVYLVLLVVFLVQGLGIALMRETVSRAPGALASLRPEITLPRAVRARVLTAAPALFAVWALAGLYGALGPALVTRLGGGGSPVLGGLSLFTMAGVAALTTVVLRTQSPGRTMRTGVVALIIGVAVTLAGLEAGSLPVFFLGTAIAGIGFGAGFQGGLRTSVPQAAPHERAGVLSLLFVVSYLGFGVPAVVAGVLVVHGPGLVGAALIYGGVLIALALLALVRLLTPVRTSDPEPVPVRL
ncbi:MFS transporter [Crossiella sp. CA-258035]|uniref:MFS transporter n=1 Tax=Crossiella sp. CA-258035 TaxID=2981138 RepID=UPI0024BC7C2F|nr:MFS transporter [Crossiella sp. CA-258035]WHT23201.1 MFS transporter [Crossiella sp. CA-258035]